MQKLLSGCTGRQSKHPERPNLAQRSLNGNPATSGIPPCPVSSNVSCRMLPLSRCPAIAKLYLPSLSGLHLLTSFLPITLSSLQTPSPSFPPPYSLPKPPHTQAFLLTTSRSPRIYFPVPQTFPDSLRSCSLPPDPIVYPPVFSGGPPTLSLFTRLLP